MVINSNIFPGMGLADPHAIVENGRVYLFCGHDKSPLNEADWIMDKWCIVSSDDLKTWRVEGEILPTQNYIGNQDNCWAGYILKNNNKYYWYFSNKFFDTGVMVSDTIEGPYKDALGKPLIPQGAANTRCYDPCVYEEDGEYTIFFGSGKYYAARLNDDMISLAEEPKLIEIYDNDGKIIGLGDKSTVFKHNSIYYLVSGNVYATSDKLMGPYKYAGRFLGGGHNDVFEFKGKQYICCEFHDTCIFCRGVMIKELNFNEDGSLVIDENDPDDVFNEKEWIFKEAQRGWHLESGNQCYDGTSIIYPVYKDEKLISAYCPGIEFRKDTVLSVELENHSDAKELSVDISTIDTRRGYWKKDTPLYHSHFDKALYAEEGLKTIEIPLKFGEDVKLILRRIGLSAKGTHGDLVIKRISIKENA